MKTWLLAAAVWVLAGPVLGADPAALSLADLGGNPQTLEQLRGRVVVLNFWATWCIPCRAEMPVLIAAQNRYASRGVVVIGASVDDESTRGDIQAFIAKLGISFPIWTGATAAHMEEFGLGTALPATAILDAEGRIAFRIKGLLTRKDLTRRLDYLLSTERISGRRDNAPEPLLDNTGLAESDHKGHEHEEDEEHTHGGVGVEGASTVPS